MARTSVKYSQPGDPVDMGEASPGLWYFEGEPQPEIMGSSVFLEVKSTNQTGQTFLVAKVRGRTPGECRANAQLLVNISAALQEARAKKVMEQIKPAVGSKVQILVDEPDDAELKQGDVCTVVENPDGEDTSLDLWLEKDGAEDHGVWALNLFGHGNTWRPHEVVGKPDDGNV